MSVPKIVLNIESVVNAGEDTAESVVKIFDPKDVLVAEVVKRITLLVEAEINQLLNIRDASGNVITSPPTSIATDASGNPASPCVKCCCF
jgi:hypothetical protein